MELVFIRHGKTKGNLKSRYIGITDEGLCKEGIEEINGNLCQGIYPVADIIFTSPMKRCIQTAEIIYPGKSLNVIYGFREINFGRFEGKIILNLAAAVSTRNGLTAKGQKISRRGRQENIFQKMHKWF